MRTNNGLERYNRSLGEIFEHTQPSLIAFVEKLEEESRNQVKRLDYIPKAFIVNKKRKMEEKNIHCEFSKPSLLYNQFKLDYLMNKQIVN